MGSVPQPVVDSIADRWGIPRCDDCGRQAFDSDYQKLGNHITKLGSTTASVLAAGYLLAPVLAATEIPVQFASKALKKAGYDDRAEQVKQFSTVDEAMNQLEAGFDAEAEELRWVNNDSQQLCYVCKDGGPDTP